MAKTVVGLFDTMDEAQQVVQDLVNAGFDRNDIGLVARDAKNEYQNISGDRATGDGGDGNNAGEGAGAGAVGGTVVGGIVGLLVGIGALAIPGIGPVIAAGTLGTVLGTTALGAGIGAAAGGLIGALVGMGVPEEDAKAYSEGVRRGGALVTVKSSDESADDAYDIIQRHNPVDIDERSGQWKQSGWNGFDENAKPYNAQEIDTYRNQQVRPAAATTTNTTNTANTNTAARTTGANVNTARNLNDRGEAVLPVVEEELQVGKRQVQTGGVRVYSHVEQRPVEEQVNLREERVDVNRRPVNRPVSDADMAAFKEGTIEVTTTAEQPVVNKQARVVEEVVVNKDVQERNQTIRDNVRRTDVEVEQLGAQNTPRTGTMRFEDYDTDFRNNYQTRYANSGLTYDQYSPAYRYGYDLANNQRYAGRRWEDIQNDVRTDWERRNPNSKWDQFKDSVRYAWDRAATGAKNTVTGNDNTNYNNTNRSI
jgi:uncharacterized protein (TIGR02271 family)